MSTKDLKEPQREDSLSGGSESQNAREGSNKATRKPSEPGMNPGIGNAAADANSTDAQNAQKEKADLEQQFKETLTERD